MKTQNSKSEIRNKSERGSRAWCPHRAVFKPSTCNRALSSGAAVFAANQRLNLAGDHLLGNVDVQNIIAARHVIHNVEHKPFQQAAQGASASAFFDGLSRQFTKGIFR